MALPPLPAGEYRIFADIVLENGFAPTLVDTVRLPQSRDVPGEASAAGPDMPDNVGTERDPDDSWAKLQPLGASRSLEYALPSGRVLRREREGPVVADQKVFLRFTVRERANGSPAALEPYMGMLNHAAVLRHDGSVFVHLHPAGSINLTAQRRFEAAEAVSERAAEGAAGHMRHAPDAPSNTVTFPFVFPQPGAWRVFVQVKVGGTVETAALDVDVGGPAGA